MISGFAIATEILLSQGVVQNGLMLAEGCYIRTNDITLLLLLLLLLYHYYYYYYVTLDNYWIFRINDSGSF